MSKLRPPHGAEASQAIDAGSVDAAVTCPAFAAIDSESTFEYVFGAGGADSYGAP
jgi:hypothetical protein